MKFRAVAVVTVGAGAVLGLSGDQAAARRHSLDPVPGRDGWYVSHRPVQFKVGEEFDYEGELPKCLAQAVAAPEAAPYVPPQPQATRRRKS